MMLTGIVEKITGLILKEWLGYELNSSKTLKSISAYLMPKNIFHQIVNIKIIKTKNPEIIKQNFLKLPSITRNCFWTAVAL